jgi:hypothetical protein
LLIPLLLHAGNFFLAFLKGCSGSCRNSFLTP